MKLKNIKERFKVFMVKKATIFLKKKMHIYYFLIETYYKLRKIFRKPKTLNISNTKNIMFLISHLNNGGAERVVSNLSDELSKKYNVIIVTYSDISDNDYHCNVERINIDYRSKLVLKYFYLVNQIRKIKKDYKITHTISFCPAPNYFNVLTKESDIVITSIRNYMSEFYGLERIAHSVKVVGKYSDKLVSVSELTNKDQIENFGVDKDKTYVINNYCDTEKIDKLLKEELPFKKNGKTVINIARLHPQKCHIGLIHAFKYVVEEIPDAKLIILGYGPLKKEVQAEIDNLNLSKNVFLYGFKKNPYIYMKSSDIFVLSSLYEGMSNAMLEAMYCGLPVISTDCRSGTREILAPDTDLDMYNTTITKEKYGVLVPIIKTENEERIMANAIIEMLKNKELREHYSNKSKERIKDFRKDDILKKWIDLIEET